MRRFDPQRSTCNIASSRNARVSSVRDDRRSNRLENVDVETEPLSIVDVQHATNGTGELLIQRTGGLRLVASEASQAGPASMVTPIQIVDIESGFFQEDIEADIAETAEFAGEVLPGDVE